MGMKLPQQGLSAPGGVNMTLNPEADMNGMQGVPFGGDMESMPTGPDQAVPPMVGAGPTPRTAPIARNNLFASQQAPYQFAMRAAPQRFGAPAVMPSGLRASMARAAALRGGGYRG
jgi:hypothetical protein